VVVVLMLLSYNFKKNTECQYIIV